MTSAWSGQGADCQRAAASEPNRLQGVWRHRGTLIVAFALTVGAACSSAEPPISQAGATTLCNETALRMWRTIVGEEWWADAQPEVRTDLLDAISGGCTNIVTSFDSFECTVEQAELALTNYWRSRFSAAVDGKSGPTTAEWEQFMFSGDLFVCIS